MKRNVLALKEVLDSYYDDGGVEAERKMIDLYHSCLDTDEIVKLGSTPLLMLINETGNAPHIQCFLKMCTI